MKRKSTKQYNFVFTKKLRNLNFFLLKNNFRFRRCGWLWLQLTNFEILRENRTVNFNYFSAVDTDPREGNTKFCGRYFGNGANPRVAAAGVVSRCSKKNII